jgi:hypothetical protein
MSAEVGLTSEAAGGWSSSTVRECPPSTYCDQPIGHGSSGLEKEQSQVWLMPAQWVFGTPVTCRLAMIAKGRLPGLPPSLMAHGAQT